MKIYGKQGFLTLTIGIVSAMVLVFSQLFYFQAATYCQKKAECEQKEKQLPVGNTEDKAGHEAHISIPSYTISSVSHIHINDAVSSVLETLFEVEKEAATSVASPATNRLFQTLFRFIIAANAP